MDSKRKAQKPETKWHQNLTQARLLGAYQGEQGEQQRGTKREEKEGE